MHRWVALLHPPVVSRANQLAGLIENRGANRNAAFLQAQPRFRQRHREHRVVVQLRTHRFSSLTQQNNLTVVTLIPENPHL